MSDFNISIDVQDMIRELPEGIYRALLDALANHVGREKSISRRELVMRLSPLLREKYKPSRFDRSVRLAINQLRKQGYPICSTGGPNGGYFIAANREELEEYLQLEIHARAMDLLQQEQSMRAGSARLWPSQPGLF